MRVKVTKIFDDNTVDCSNQFGSFKLNWEGGLPDINKEYDVELDINEPLSWDEDISLSRLDNFYIENEGGVVALHGMLESVDNDGYTILRMGNNIVAFLTKGEAFEVGSMIKVCTDSIVAMPIAY